MVGRHLNGEGYARWVPPCAKKIHKMTTTQAYAQQYHDNLFNDVLPFWQRHSIDREQGGFFTCLDQTGKVYDTDKFIWLQARQVWTFAMLHNRLGGTPLEQHRWSTVRLAGNGAAWSRFFAEIRSGRRWKLVFFAYPRR